MFKALIGSACAAVIVVSGVHLYGMHANAEAIEAAHVAAVCASAEDRLASSDATAADRNTFIVCGLRDVLHKAKDMDWHAPAQDAQELAAAHDLRDAW